MRIINSEKCLQEQNCKLPDCFCATFQHPVLNVSSIPQMVYFAFDDALTPLVDPYYKKLFCSNRKNPNGCPISMTLFVSNQYTSYEEVKYFYDAGMEIGSHSVKHDHIRTAADLYQEALQQRKNLVEIGRIPESDVVGWRSPFLETAGDHQPDILHNLGYKYDVSITYRRSEMSDQNPWPFTADFGWPFLCQMEPCPSKPHPGFWEFPVNTMVDFKNQYPCNYVDGCVNRPENEDESFKYLMDNFMTAYTGNKAPFGIHMHASWFITKYNYKAMEKFMDEILKLPDVYIVTLKQVLDWMKSPTSLSNIAAFSSWQCRQPSLGLTPIQKPLKSSSKISNYPTSTAGQTSTTTSITPTTSKATITTQSTTTHGTAPRTAVTSTTKLRKVKPTITQTVNFITEAKLALKNEHEEMPTDRRSSHSPLTRPTTPSSIMPVTNSATSNNLNWSWMWAKIFNNNQQHPWLTATVTNNKEMDTKCIQGVNCVLPDCFCEGDAIPGDLSKADTPQFVVMSFDGDIDSQVFMKYRKLFSGERKNPNNCPISCTFFLSQLGTRDEFMSYLSNKGQEIAMRGSSSFRSPTIEQFNEDLSSQKHDMAQKGLQVFGWRSPELKPRGDQQFSLLTNEKLHYDSTLVLSVGKAGKQWPFTLDFGWTNDCVINECPKRKYPGLWEVPSVPVIDYQNLYPCNYVDGCMYSPQTAEETFQFLWNNFERSYMSNKAPFTINLRHIWFTHVAYKNNVKGFEMFLEKLSEIEDVFIVSNEKLLQWTQRPIPLSELKSRHC